MEPPPYLDERLVPIWREVVEHIAPSKTINPVRLEAYCAQIDALRMAHLDIASAGVTQEDARGRTVANPALAVIREMHGALAKWGNEFAPASNLKRRRGPMFDATCVAVNNASHLKDRKDYEGAIAAVKTLAWLIDEAQRLGIEALQGAAFGTIPSYLKGCAELRITPASAPVLEAAPQKQGKVGALLALTGGGTGAAGA